MYKEGGGGFNTRCELVHILEQVIDWLFLNCRLRIKSSLCGNHFFFHYNKIWILFYSVTPSSPSPPKKEKKKEKKRERYKERENM